MSRSSRNTVERILGGACAPLYKEGFARAGMDAIARAANGNATGVEIITMPKIAGVAAGRLRSFVERIERLEEEKQALTNDIGELYSEAKGAGFDVKVLRHVVRLRKMDASARSQMEVVLDVYKRALDM